MKEYIFDLILTNEPSDDQVEQIGAWISAGGPAPKDVLDVTPGISCGAPYLGCTVRAPSLEQAVALVLPHLQAWGLEAKKIELDLDFARTT